MSEAKHTPRPWWSTEYGIRNSGGFICALVHPTKYPGQGERYATEKSAREADARLIAAAPDLLDALESSMTALEVLAVVAKSVGVDKHLPGLPFVMESARAAIKAAKGEA